METNTAPTFRPTGNTQTVYGIEMPVWAYTARFSCGHDVEVECASVTPIAAVYVWETPCSKCYTGPYFNVFD